MNTIDDLPSVYYQPPGWALDAVREEFEDRDDPVPLSEIHARAFEYAAQQGYE